ncbi:hypothetical protein [Alistipes finegoldii]|uniref:hypothetical protein n=1 Tax=Alistipes finegoldii TaxID=214856 RepID=UPI00189847AB|nr:hypothetical protein [Alistipes finegoldii]
MQTKIVKIWRLRTRAGKILRTDFRIRRKTGYERTERQGGAVRGKWAERRPQKSKRNVGRRKAGGPSAGKSRRTVRRRKAGGPLPKRKRKTKEKQADRQPQKADRLSAGKKQETVGTETSGESEKSRRKNPAAFLHFRTAGGTPGDQ